MEAIKARGYFSDVYRATEMLMERFEMVSDEARTKEQFTASVMPLVEDFTSYVKSLTEALPDVAFKMAVKAAELTPVEAEPVVVEAEAPADTQEVQTDAPVVDEPAGETDAETAPETEESQPEAEEESTVVVDEVPDEPVDTEPDSAEGDTVEVVKADEDEVGGLALIQAAIRKMEEKQTETFQKFDERLSNLSEKVTTKAASRTTGAVAATPPKVVEETTTTVKKDASLSRPIDTGYRSISKK